MRVALTMPAKPARSELRMKRPIFTLAVFTPRAMAERSLPPVAVIQLPRGERSRRNQVSAASTTNQKSPALTVSEPMSTEPTSSDLRSDSPCSVSSGKPSEM